MALVGDGICDDDNNKVDCYFDGGDCCLDDIVISHCSECTCYQQGTCAAGFFPDTVGDGVCNDELNNAHCYYDGLDCCRYPVNKTLCSNCACHGKFKPLYRQPLIVYL